MIRSWRRILREHYGIAEASPWDQRTCFSRHLFLATPRGNFVLSRARKDPWRLPFALQFRIMHGLRSDGLRVVAPPMPTADGGWFVEAGQFYWYLRAYTADDPVSSWFLAPLVTDAARRLAELHETGADPWWERNGLPVIEAGAIEPYQWSVTDVVDRMEDLVAGYRPQGRDEGPLLRRSVTRLLAGAPDALATARGLGLVGLTHEDYRPDNLLVRHGRIVSVLDWDRARHDHQLYDVAFAALQFGGRQCLRPSAILGLADHFIQAYLAARGMSGLRLRHPSLIPWMLRFAVTKRLLAGDAGEDRTELLQRLEASHVIAEEQMAPHLRRPRRIPPSRGPRP